MELQDALAPPPRPGRPIAGFFVDLAIAIGALLILSFAGGLAWALFEGARLAIRDGAAFDPAGAIRMLGEPGAIAMILMTLVSTGGAALLVYYWRRRATPQEKYVSRQAAQTLGTWGWVIATGVVTFVLISTLSFVGQHFGISPEPTNLALIEAAFAANPLFMLLFGVVIAPAYEELLFRRVLFGRLWQRGGLGSAHC